MIDINMIDLVGIRDAVRKSFASVFGELNISTEAWFQKTKFLKLGKKKYEEYIIRRVGIFPLFCTSQSAFIDSSYVRINISNEIAREKYRAVDIIHKQLVNQKEGCDEVIAENERTPIEALEHGDENFALLGGPGSGKTTIFRHLAVCAAKGMPIRGKKRLPLFFAVRDLAQGQQDIQQHPQAILQGKGEPPTRPQTIQEAATIFLTWLGVEEASRVLEHLLKSGHCIIFIDGLDETTTEHQRALLHEISEINAKYSSVIIALSARPYSLSVGLSNFTKWETLPLRFEDRLLFVEKWFSIINPAKGLQLKKMCEDKPDLLDIGSNPLLLSILCALYDNDLNIPEDSDELYRRCVEGLLGAWDAFRNVARKTPLANLSITKRLVLVSWLAASLLELKKIVFTVDDVNILGCFDRAANVLRIPHLEAEEVLRSLYNDFGLLVERSPRYYSFSHLSLHEYLTARYIVDNRKETQLLTGHKDWFEIIRYVLKMLPNANSFMMTLHNKISFHSAYDVLLLREAWRSMPICDPEIAERLGIEILKRFQLLAALDNNTKLNLSELIINVKSANAIFDYILPEELLIDKLQALHFLYGLLSNINALKEILSLIGFSSEHIPDSWLLNQSDLSKLKQITLLEDGKLLVQAFVKTEASERITASLPYSEDLIYLDNDVEENEDIDY